MNRTLAWAAAASLTLGVIAGALVGLLRGGDGFEEIEDTSPAAATPSERAGIAATLSGSRGRTPASASPAGAAPAPEGFGTPSDADFARIVSELGLNQQHTRIAPFFPDKESGRALMALTLLASELSNPGSIAGRFGSAKHRELTEHPEETFQTVTAVLAQFPPGLFPDKRQFLIQFAADLDVDVEARVDFLMTEARVTPPPSGREPGSNAAVFTPSVAIERIFRLYDDDPQKSEAVLRQVLESHPAGSEVRRSLIMSFARINPERARELEAQGAR